MSSTIYSIPAYGLMIADFYRMDAYLKALQKAVQPEAVVLDIGAGTGICTFLACQLGAKIVYAIESSYAINVAQAVAIENRFDDHIEFIQNISTKISLPEAVDVIVSDLRGVLPLFQQHIPSLIDARKRFLKPDGILVPQQDQLWVTVIEAADLYQSYASPWVDQPYGFNMQAAKKFVTNTWGKAKEVTPEMFLVKPQCWATLDYRTIANPDVSAELEWTVDRPGIAHGLCLWFDATLIDGVGFSNAPGQPELIYGRAFFPLTNPTALEKGDILLLKLKADLVGDDYIWSWATKVLSQGNPKDIKANFKQSTFYGVPLSPKQLQKQSNSFIPKLNTTAKIDALVLNLMEQRLTLGEIAQQITEQFSDCFPNWKAALSYVGELSQKYSE